MQAQVVLDRLGFTPGVVDGKMGMSTVNAHQGLPGGSRACRSPASSTRRPSRRWREWKHIPATRVVTIPEEFANDRFVAIPKEREDQAKLDRMGYRSLAEKLAERFHTTEEVLAELNPQLTGGGAPLAEGSTANQAAPKPAIAYRAGMQLRVPNIGADRFDRRQSRM